LTEPRRPRFAALAAAALWLALPGAARAGLEICNDTALLQSVAIGYKGDTDWTSEGWWNIAPGDCALVLAGGLTRRYYYYYAEAAGAPFESQDYLFCGSEEIFEITGDTDCEGRGYETLSMREIDTGETARDFTLTLVDGGGAPSNTDKQPGGEDVAGLEVGGGPGGPPRGAPLNEAVQDTLVVPEEAPMTVSVEDLVTDITQGKHGKPFETGALFQGCELEDGREYCSFHAGDWKMRVFYRGPTPERLMYALEELAVNMPVRLKADMVETTGNIAAIVVRAVEPRPGGDPHARLRAALQGSWAEQGGSGREITLHGSEVHLRTHGSYTGSHLFRLTERCASAGTEGPAMVRIDPETNARDCFVITRPDGATLELRDARSGRRAVYRRVP
jgi:uncharacterized membrane protein